MWLYWAMFLLAASAALNSGSSGKIAAASSRSAGWGVAWISVSLLLTLLIGFRYQVGGDWYTYLRILEATSSLDFVEVLTKSDPGYQMLNWLSLKMDWGIYGVNLICGAVFVFGLIVFCRSMPLPWIALASAIPYLVIVVAMGYSRQAVALGLVMLGLTALSKNSSVWYVIWVALAAAFHKSALLLLPIAALAAAQNRYWTAAWVMVTGAALYNFLLEKEVESLYTNYVTANIQSEGALVRLLMNALPATILLIWRRRFQFAASEERLWVWCAIISLALVAIFIATPASTAVDRIGLYMLPLQLVVFTHLPHVFGTQSKRREAPTAAAGSPNSGARRSAKATDVQGLTAAVLLYYGTVQFVWLNYGTWAVMWVPYHFYSLEFSF
jgi:hypothetical protein